MQELRSTDVFVYHGYFRNGVFECTDGLNTANGSVKTLDAWHQWLTGPAYIRILNALILRCDDAPHKYLYLHREHKRLPVKKEFGRGLLSAHIFPDAQWVDEDQLDAFIAKVTLTGVPK